MAASFVRSFILWNLFVSGFIAYTACSDKMKEDAVFAGAEEDELAQANTALDRVVYAPIVWMGKKFTAANKRWFSKTQPKREDAKWSIVHQGVAMLVIGEFCFMTVLRVYFKSTGDELFSIFLANFATILRFIAIFLVATVVFSDLGNTWCKLSWGSSFPLFFFFAQAVEAFALQTGTVAIFDGLGFIFFFFLFGLTFIYLQKTRRNMIEKLKLSVRMHHVHVTVFKTVITIFPPLLYLSAEYFACLSRVYCDWIDVESGLITEEEAGLFSVEGTRCKALYHGIAPMLIMLITGAVGSYLACGRADTQNVTLEKVLELSGLPKVARAQLAVAVLLGIYAIIKFGMRREGSVSVAEKAFSLIFTALAVLLALTEAASEKEYSRESFRGIGDKDGDENGEEDSDSFYEGRGTSAGGSLGEGSGRTLNVGEPRISSSRITSSKRVSTLEMRVMVGQKKGIWDGGTRGAVRNKTVGEKQGLDRESNEEKLFDFDPGLV